MVGVVDGHGRRAARPLCIVRRCRLVRRFRGELEDAPPLWQVHCDLALWRPDPIVLFWRPWRWAGLTSGLFRVSVARGVHEHIPLDAAEVDSPEGAMDRHVERAVVCELAQWKSDLYAPLRVGCGRVVYNTGWRYRHGAPQRRLHVPTVRAEDPGRVLEAAVAIGLVQGEIPSGVERIHFELLVIVCRRVGIYKDLEVVVMKDHGIVLCESRPDIWLLQFGSDVKEAIVPTNLGPGPKLRDRCGGNVDEVFSPRHLRPNGLAQVAIQSVRT
mmetsp:Transcript_3213/g.6881  ORF Transcript_3213/g.6881 Transcript_3213/m.6881 type:complete len:271 (-) Transcript_3213:213-1025(-)